MSFMKRARSIDQVGHQEREKTVGCCYVVVDFAWMFESHKALIWYFGVWEIGPHACLPRPAFVNAQAITHSALATSTWEYIYVSFDLNSFPFASLFKLFFFFRGKWTHFQTEFNRKKKSKLASSAHENESHFLFLFFLRMKNMEINPFW